jgi:PAS domain S-box-containing protein
MQFGADLTLFNGLEEAAVAVDAEGRIVFVNAAAERMFGYPQAEILGHDLDILVPERRRMDHRRHVDAFRASPARSRMMSERRGIEGRRRDGSVFDAEASISRITTADGDILLALVRDVTERRVREARLLSSEQKHRAILETCTDAILLADAESGRIVEVNAQAAVLFGCDPADLLGRHQSELHPAADRKRLTRAFREHIERQRIMVPDATIQRDDGEVVPVEIAAKPTRIAGVLTVVGFFRDVTHREERERALIEAREAALAATHSKSTFLANVSHELRTPLNAIIGLSEMIGGEYLGPAGHPKYVEYARDIRDSGNHLRDIIDDILDVSRLELGKVVLHETEVDLEETVAQGCRTLHRIMEENRLVCRHRLGPGARRLYADQRSVRQMLLNLLSNAIRHTPPGGSVEIAAERLPGGEIALRVADTGRGIDPERLADVATPFNGGADRTVSASGGTGLGLAITKGLIERHGGRFEIASRPGAGTTVRLVFPAERGRPDAA